MSDWDSVTVIRKKPQKAATLKTEAAINAAKRAGVEISTEKKAAVNSHGTLLDAGKAIKVDNETEDFKVVKVPLSLAKTIQQARASKGLTQKDLATKINEKQTIINEYEAGKAIPNQQILGKMERILGVKLRGSGIGQPLGK